MEAAEFLTTCRRIEALRLDSSTALNAGRALNDELRPRFAQTRPAWEELIQHLTDLCYLTPNQRENHQIVTAVEAFIAEDNPVYWQDVAPIPARGGNARREWLDHHLPFVVYRLSPYTNFDGELSPRPDYRIGERSAYGRSLAFRLRVFFYRPTNRRSGRRKEYFDRASVPFLFSLNNSLHGAVDDRLPDREDSQIAVEVQELLLHWQPLFDTYRSVNNLMPSGRGRYLMVYTIAGKAPPPDLVDANGRRQDRRSRRVTRRVAREQVHQETGSNQLGIRLLQLGLWRAGFYTGKLDGDFGSLSHEALVGLIEQEYTYGRGKGRGSIGKRKLQKLLLPTDDDDNARYAVDLRLLGRVLDAYAPVGEAKTAAEEQRIWTDIRNRGLEDRVGEALKSLWKSKAPPTRRYYGLRGLVRGAFRAVGRVLRWLADRVGAVVGAVADFLRATLKRVGEGVKLFVDGFGYLLHFVLGRPFVTEGVAATRFALDFDAVNIVDPTASSDRVMDHVEWLRQIRRSVTYFLDVATGAVRLIARLQPPVSWWRLVIMVARYVRRWLSARGRPSGSERTGLATPQVA